MQSCRFTTETENMKNFNERYPDFDAFQDMDILAEKPSRCMIRTYKLLAVLLFMQEYWRRLFELLPDDEWQFEYNILTFYKPKQWATTD